MKRRPNSVTVAGVLFIVVGAFAMAVHAADYRPDHPFDGELLWIFAVRLLAIVGGAFVLQGKNWARWLLIVWLGYHLCLSFFHSPTAIAVHAGLLALFTWLLCRAPAQAYFRP